MRIVAPIFFPLALTKGLTACLYVQAWKTVKVKKNTTWNIEKKVNCDIFNCEYMIQCTTDNCKQQYIGQTGRQLKFRIANHRGYIQNQVTSKATGAHWNQPGHSQADMKLTVLEQVRYNDRNYREERETFFINKFDTFYNYINKEVG